MLKPSRLQSILDRAVDRTKIFGASFCVQTSQDLWAGAGGDMKTHSQFFIASTTKLFVSAVIHQLRSQNKLRLDDRAATYLEPEILRGLVVVGGTDYYNSVSIKNLLAHTSGIPDYFGQKGADGTSLQDALQRGIDQSWSIETIIKKTRALDAPFAPNTPKRAFYSDTNYQLLGLIIERITKQPLAQVLQERILDPLHLENTYMYADPTDERPQVMRYREQALHIPHAMASFTADGGMVSTASDLMTFLRAFFNGKFFPVTYLTQMYVWNDIFSPLQAGIGIHRFALPWYMNPFGSIPEFVGHSGLSGTVAFFAPSKNLFITGTVNQVAHPDAAFRLMIKLAMDISKPW
ncbi:MAG: serine hydrolase domain-containing protein [Candidatus Kapaibacterium sp.]|jgi:D-alanyl-D-alanine carboxypeptidase